MSCGRTSSPVAAGRVRGLRGGQVSHRADVHASRGAVVPSRRALRHECHDGCFRPHARGDAARYARQGPPRGVGPLPHLLGDGDIHDAAVCEFG